MESGKARVLIVDDERDVREILGEAVTTASVEVEYAENGRQALEAHLGNRASVIVTDLVMPVMTGQELLRALRDDGDDVPVIVISGHASVDDAILAIKLGAFDLITKPFVLRDVRAVVGEALSVGELMRSAEQEILEKMRAGSLPEGLSLAHVRTAKHLAFLRRMRESSYFSSGPQGPS